MSLYYLKNAKLAGQTLDTESHAAMTFEAEEVSDGHHTFTELYEHRYALFCALTKVYDNYITPIGHRVRCWKSKLHNDGTSYEGWFIAGITFKDVKMNEYQITYHIPNDWWKRFNLFELERAPKWDGHNSNNVIARLLML